MNVCAVASGRVARGCLNGSCVRPSAIREIISRYALYKTCRWYRLTLLGHFRLVLDLQGWRWREEGCLAMPQSVRAYQVKEIEGKSWTVPQKRFSFSESDLATDIRGSGLTVFQHCFGSDKMTVQDKEARGSGPSEVQLCMHTQRGFFFTSRDLAIRFCVACSRRDRIYIFISLTSPIALGEGRQALVTRLVFAVVRKRANSTSVRLKHTAD